MYRGVVELESLNEPTILQTITVKDHKENHPEATVKTWHVHKVEVSDGKINSVTEKISKTIKRDWYAIFWSDYQVYAVFYNKIFKVTRKNVKSGDYKEIKIYAVSHGIQEEFIDLQKEIDSW